MNPPFVRERIAEYLRSKILTSLPSDVTNLRGSSIEVVNVMGSSFLMRVKDQGHPAEYFEVKVTHKIL